MTVNEAIVSLCKGQQEASITVCIGDTTVRHVFAVSELVTARYPHEFLFVEFDHLIRRAALIEQNKESVTT